MFRLDPLAFELAFELRGVAGTELEYGPMPSALALRASSDHRLRGKGEPGDGLVVLRRNVEGPAARRERADPGKSGSQSGLGPRGGPDRGASGRFPTPGDAALVVESTGRGVHPKASHVRANPAIGRVERPAVRAQREYFTGSALAGRISHAAHEGEGTAVRIAAEDGDAPARVQEQEPAVGTRR